MTVHAIITLERRETMSVAMAIQAPDETTAAENIRNRFAETHPGWHIAVITTTGEPDLKPVRSGVESPDVK